MPASSWPTAPVLSESAISKYTTSLFGKLGITDDDNNNRRVLAVLTYLNKS
ncbi:hypothetical protein [Nonomuraea sp. bgisy101]|uniref:hypothetical protein n=1 Tax=unclassified Nonomuraea TaxID=2593643 RepID=UPI003D721F0C